MSKQKFSVKSVIFDMDGVITNTMPDHYKAWKLILKKYGITVTHLDIYSREGQRGIYSVEELSAQYKKKFDEKLTKKILKEKEKLFKKIVKKRFIIGARQFLKNLHRKNIPLALVTGTSHHEVRQILPHNLYNLFSTIITGSHVKYGKPHPEPYIKSLKRLKIKPSEAVVIENAPFGIKSAKGAGIKCFAIETSLPKPYLKGADKVFSSFKELQSKIDFCNVNGFKV